MPIPYYFALVIVVPLIVFVLLAVFEPPYTETYREEE